MLRWILLASAVLVALLSGAAGYRYLQIIWYPIGGGRFEDSPDGRFTAHASNMYDEDFWGNSRRYYQFEVVDRNGVVLRSVKLPEPANPVRFREGTGQVIWSPDSKSVAFGTPPVPIWSTTVP